MLGKTWPPPAKTSGTEGKSGERRAKEEGRGACNSCLASHGVLIWLASRMGSEAEPPQPALRALPSTRCFLPTPSPQGPTCSPKQLPAPTAIPSVPTYPRGFREQETRPNPPKRTQRVHLSPPTSPSKPQGGVQSRLLCISRDADTSPGAPSIAQPPNPAILQNSAVC